MGTLGALLVGVGSAVMILSVLVKTPKEAALSILAGGTVAGGGFWLAWLSAGPAPGAQGLPFLPQGAWWAMMMSQAVGTFIGGLLLHALSRKLKGR